MQPYLSSVFAWLFHVVSMDEPNIYFVSRVEVEPTHPFPSEKMLGSGVAGNLFLSA